MLQLIMIKTVLIAMHTESQNTPVGPYSKHPAPFILVKYNDCDIDAFLLLAYISSRYFKCTHIRMGEIKNRVSIIDTTSNEK